MKVRQTSCRFCSQDIENFTPYHKGEWRDRGNNRHCPTPEGDAGRFHAPFRPGVDDRPPCPATLSGMKCELPAGHRNKHGKIVHKRGAAGWEASC